MNVLLVSESTNRDLPFASPSFLHSAPCVWTSVCWLRTAGVGHFTLHYSSVFLSNVQFTVQSYIWLSGEFNQQTVVLLVDHLFWNKSQVRFITNSYTTFEKKEFFSWRLSKDYRVIMLKYWPTRAIFCTYFPFGWFVSYQQRLYVFMYILGCFMTSLLIAARAKFVEKRIDRRAKNEDVRMTWVTHWWDWTTSSLTDVIMDSLGGGKGRRSRKQEYESL